MLKISTKVGIENSTSLAFASGTENTQVRGSLRLINETLPFPNTSRNQIDASVNGSVQITDNLSAYSSLNYQIRKTENFPVNGYGGLGGKL